MRITSRRVVTIIFKNEKDALAFYSKNRNSNSIEKITIGYTNALKKQTNQNYYNIIFDFCK